MKITALSAQQRDPNRVNVSVDGKYKFSLDITQVVSLGVKIGNEYTEEEMTALEQESQFGKLYARALEYSMVRPRSVKELRDYLWRKTLTKKIRTKTGEIIDRPGASKETASRVLERLIEKGYLNDEKFARFWFEHRFMQKGTSLRRLRLELAQKGIEKHITEQLISENIRSDEEELQKIILKKRGRYPDRQKFIQYLVRQGFSYDMVIEALDGSA
ncbi:MAG TPA: RecX family transcriptional regulator [Candidatus Saccharibacteria bacterium]|jgi:regulatory protein|nr:RecX family transcriptional regulator [Candidatus Saccharibacteria bacterium]HMR38414.1 RecX family transcriptional regulator [Candidatus Saccharibacteria bacterium]